ncbi:hypothetical protein JN27_13535 [Massilia sp. BSC265]|nr:hypothetical protein JN27_13535 [Massilia sp. BSC265]
MQVGSRFYPRSRLQETDFLEMPEIRAVTQFYVDADNNRAQLEVHMVVMLRRRASPSDSPLTLHDIGQRYNMNVVVEFPKKIFVQWGALAQELASSLSRLGATKAEVKEITARLQVKWEQPDTPPTPKGLCVIPSLEAGKQAAEAGPADKKRPLRTCAYWESQDARTLIELARYEYRQAPAL